MKLENLLPSPSRFYLRLVDRWFTMRPITLQDEIWIADTFGEGITKIFEELNIKEIVRIVFNQLDAEDKKFFVKKDVEIVDENGLSEVVEIGGVDLLYSLISGIEEKNGIVQGLLDVIGVSRPEQDNKKKVEI